jgi:hypothetical protein
MSTVITTKSPVINPEKSRRSLVLQTSIKQNLWVPLVYLYLVGLRMVNDNAGAESV